MAKRSAPKPAGKLDPTGDHSDEVVKEHGPLVKGGKKGKQKETPPRS